MEKWVWAHSYQSKMNKADMELITDDDKNVLDPRSSVTQRVQVYSQSVGQGSALRSRPLTQ